MYSTLRVGCYLFLTITPAQSPKGLDVLVRTFPPLAHMQILHFSALDSSNYKLLSTLLASRLDFLL